MVASPMLFVVVLVVITALCRTVVAECGDVIKPCLLQQLTEQLTPGADDCRIADNFVRCVSREVSRAERDGTCDILAELDLRQRYLHYTISHQQDCPGLVVPPYLNLTSPCDISLAECGSFAVTARFLQAKGDLVKTCIKLDEFKRCMSTISPNTCSNQTLISSLLHKEMLDRDFNTTCVGTTTSTTTTTTTTTTPTTTPTTRSSGTNDGGSVNGFQPLRMEYHLLVATVLVLCFWIL